MNRAPGPESSSDETYRNLQANWRAKEDEFASQLDDVGDPEMDKPVLEAVIALNLLGVETIDSCSGHPERDTGFANIAPYIGVGDNAKNIARAQALVDEYNSISNAEDHARIVLLNQDEREGFDQGYRRITSQGRHQIPESTFMVFYHFTKKGRGKIAKRMELGQQYTKEMLAFGDFLKTKYYRRVVENDGAEVIK